MSEVMNDIWDWALGTTSGLTVPEDTSCRTFHIASFIATHTQRSLAKSEYRGAPVHLKKTITRPWYLLEGQAHFRNGFCWRSVDAVRVGGLMRYLQLGNFTRERR